MVNVGWWTPFTREREEASVGRFGRHHLRADMLDDGSVRCPRRGEDVSIDACLSCTTRSDAGAGCWLLSFTEYEERDPLPLLPFVWDEAVSES